VAKSQYPDLNRKYNSKLRWDEERAYDERGLRQEDKGRFPDESVYKCHRIMAS